MITDNNKMQGIPDPLAPDHIKKPMLSWTNW
jgi:hypothetical protein